MLDICPGGARASCSQGGVSSATKPPKKRVAGSPCLPDMLLALPCRSLVRERSRTRKQNFSPAVSLLRPLLIKFNIVPSGKGENT